MADKLIVNRVRRDYGQEPRTQEIITFEEKEDNWICICGNIPESDGFYPCDRKGKSVEPTVKNWPEALYRCDNCERIIRQQDRRVIGQVS